MTNALTAYDPQTFEMMQRISRAMMASGFFSDVNDIAQAYVKIQAGAELGIPPFAALTGINIQGGKPTLGANLIATLIDRHPSYSYRVRVLTDEECSIEFFQNGESVGVSSFTMKDAQTAKVWSKKQGGFIPLTQHNQNWQSYPRNMLFARAMTNGARWYAAAVFGGAPVYTPEEMGDDSYLPEISDGVDDHHRPIHDAPPQAKRLDTSTGTYTPEDFIDVGQAVEEGEYTASPMYGDGEPVAEGQAQHIYAAFVAANDDAPSHRNHLKNWWAKHKHEYRELEDGQLVPLAEEDELFAEPTQPALVDEPANGAYQE